MDLSSTTALLCMEGVQAEFERRLDDARALFGRAWDAAQDDYNRAIAAHYVAHLEPDAETAHHWNQTALAHALKDDRAEEFLGSLYVNLGDTSERLGNLHDAERYFGEAAKRGIQHFRDR